MPYLFYPTAFFLLFKLAYLGGVSAPMTTTIPQAAFAGNYCSEASSGEILINFFNQQITVNDNSVAQLSYLRGLPMLNYPLSPLSYDFAPTVLRATSVSHEDEVTSFLILGHLFSRQACHD